MSFRRKNLNILLLTLIMIMGVLTVCLYRQSKLVSETGPRRSDVMRAARDTVFIPVNPGDMAQSALLTEDSTPAAVPASADAKVVEVPARTSGVKTVDPRAMLAGHPFRAEAAKILSGRLEETDSLSRHKILNYCEHLRTSYTTRDIDFIRQVFSDNALIIVGTVVKTGKASGNSMGGNSKVNYSIRSKHEYVEKLSKIFDSGKKVDVLFSEFKIMRHPTVKGIYGVTLRQKYSCGSYSDDGYLFLLWDFRNMSMPVIHVRTWQPSLSAGNEEDIIGISDFNLE